MTDDAVTIAVTPEIAEALRASVEAGEYRSTDEALRDAVRIWRREREERAERLEAIKARIRKSIEDPRPPLTVDEARARIHAFYEATLAAEKREAS